MFCFTDNEGRNSSLSILRATYPDLVGYDESGFDVDLDQMETEPEALADNGYSGREDRRIVFWKDDHVAINDPGVHAVASASWEE